MFQLAIWNTFACFANIRYYENSWIQIIKLIMCSNDNYIFAHFLSIINLSTMYFYQDVTTSYLLNSKQTYSSNSDK